METKVVLLLGLLAVCGLSQASDVPNENQLPKFCRTSDCPSYQLVKKYDNFEHRQYEETRWVTTSLEQDFLGFGMVKSFRRLFSYINGSNSEGLKINMTVPVVMYMPLKKPPAGNSTMSFFVPHEVVNPPKPTDSEVYLERSPAASIYVKPFGGYAISYTYAKQAEKLAKELRALGLQFDDAYYKSAGYNAPFEIFNRHNEVWYKAL